MARHNHSPQGQLRASIAQLAARLMAEGIEDFALAKRKAARQLGAGESQQLPNNSEIEQALRDYQTLYRGEDQRRIIAQLRRQALQVMQELQMFHPLLTGSVLRGTATLQSEIHLLLFAESAKAVELHLLSRNQLYKAEEKRYRFREGLRAIPVLRLARDQEADVMLSIMTELERRQLPLSPVDGKPLQGVRASELAAML